MRKTKKKMFVACVLAFFLLCITLFPYYYMIMQSLVDWTVVDQVFFSTDLSFKSYEYLFSNGNAANPHMWLRALMNSFIVSVPTAIISVVVGLMVGYSSVHIDFKGKKIVTNSLLFLMFFPTVILLVPRYLIFKDFANTYFGMIVPLSITLWAIFMYNNYFKTLPASVFEAARIDGASEFGILFRFGIPFSKSVTAIVFLTTFMGRWAELMWDMVISPKVDYQTLNVLISTQFKPMGNLPGPLYASSVLLTLPIIILFLCFSKQFKEGMNFMLK